MNSITIERLRRIKGPGGLGRFGLLALAVVTLLLGTLFTFGMRYWDRPVSREDAIREEAAYQSCRGTYHRGHLQEILVRFSDLEQQTIGSACATESLYDAVRALEPGTRVSLLLRPNTNMILEFRVGETVLLEFDRAVEALRRNVIGFMLLGILMYLCGIYLAIFYFVPESLRRKWSRAWRKRRR